MRIADTVAASRVSRSLMSKPSLSVCVSQVLDGVARKKVPVRCEHSPDWG